MKCSGFAGSTEGDKKVSLEGDVIKKVAKLSFLGDVLSFGVGVQEAVPARIISRWKKFKRYCKCTV